VKLSFPIVWVNVDFYHYACDSWKSHVTELFLTNEWDELHRIKDARIKMSINYSIGKNQFPWYFTSVTTADKTFLNILNNMLERCIDFEKNEGDIGSSVKMVIGGLDNWKKAPAQSLVNALVASALQGIPSLITLQLGASGKPEYPYNWVVGTQSMQYFASTKEGKEELMHGLKDYYKNTEHSKPSTALINKLLKLQERFKFADSIGSGNPFPKANVHVSMTDMQGKYKWINWKHLTQQLMLRADHSHCATDISPCPVRGFTVLNENKLAHVLEVVKNTDAPTLRLFLGMQTWLHWNRQFKRISASGAGSSSRIRFCNGELHQMAPMLMVRWEKRAEKNLEQHKRVFAMFSKLKLEMKKQLQQLTQWNGATLEMAQLKLEKLNLTLEFPADFDNIQRIQSFYSHYKTNVPWDHSLMAHKRQLLHAQFTPLQSPSYKALTATDLAWSSSFTEYLPQWNSIVVSPFELISGYSFYPMTIPDVVLYSTLGIRIAREMAQAVFGTGKHYNEVGHPIAWLSEKDESSIKNSVLARLNQDAKSWGSFSGDKSTKWNRFSTSTLTDEWGLSTAFQAWKAQNRLHPEGMLPHLPKEWTLDNVFFLTYAQDHCEVVSDSAKSRWMAKEHRETLPNEYRINLSLRQFTLFATSFDCKPTAAMCPKANANAA
jgi:hypothetical protein